MAKKKQRGPVTVKKFGHRFGNPHVDRVYRNWFDLLLWQLGYFNDRKSPPEVPADFRYPNRKKSVKKDLPQVTWINHSSFLLQIDGIVLLTDPIWSRRCSPLSFIGPKRQHPPSVELATLPNIDIILISHNHYDHLDQKTVYALRKKFPNRTWIVPTGVKKWFERRGFGKRGDLSRIIELTWWEELDLSWLGIKDTHLKITAVPCQHFSGRGLFDRNRTLWTGYVIDCKRKRKKDKKIYFTGDTGYNRRDFKTIGSNLGPMDLSLIPIGTYVPHKFMSPVHISPKEAILIHREVQSRLSIGMHWKTFRLSSESLIQPPYDLYCHLKKKKLDTASFRVLDPGQTINW